MMSITLIDIAIQSIPGAGYRFIVQGITKSETINLMENVDLTEKCRTL